MKSTWTQTKAAIAKVQQALTPAPKHVCDPDGWDCDCLRRRAINTRAPGRGAWIPRRPDWFRRR
jgi:hypothetical protein